MQRSSPRHPLIRFKTRYGFLWVGISLLGLPLASPPALAISSRTLIAPTGEAVGDGFGISVSAAGDVNGDGYGDVIVGAYLSNGNRGRADVCYGGPGADAVADLTLTGEAAGDNFGRSVSTAGDVDGDGYADVIVGANFYGGGAGRAYVYYGGPGADAVADLTLTGGAAGDNFGRSVSTAGDVNGDGYGDVIVGANFNGGAAGRAYVYYGGPGADAVADLTLIGEDVSNHFGFSVSSAGDVNGDGYGDVTVGAPGYSGSTGRAYVYYGGPGVDAVADLTLTGAPGDEFGISVSSAGDVNGDGYGDVIVGADFSGGNKGRAFVYHGGPGADAVADLTLTGEMTGDIFGLSVSSAGDVNGDGHGDVVVGAYGNSGYKGRAYVYYGGPSVDAMADLTLTGEGAGNLFGFFVSTAGDVNGDGHGDIIVAAPGYGSNTGRAYVTLIYPYEVLAPNGGEQWVAGQPATIRWRGHDVADLAYSGDAGATWTTLAVGVGGAPENKVTVVVPAMPTTFARVRVSYSGQVATRATSDRSDADFRVVLPVVAPSAAARRQLMPSGVMGGDWLGISASSAGDVNGDGYGDVIVGALGGAVNGRAYVLYGGPGADDVADLTLTGEGTFNHFGRSVSSAGDVDGDGHGDVIVGANNYSGGTGRAYVYHGGSGADNVADLTLTGVPGDQFGYSVSSAGDVNGDGFGDVIVGALEHGGNSTGQVSVYYGGPGADDVADMIMAGGAAGDWLGISVSSAGDVNGDGYGDVIAGAYGYGSGTGRAYVYYGGAAPDTVADLTLTGEATFFYFGVSVSGAGDVNGDGYDDVIVGSQGFSSSTGRAYVYYGGPGADAVPDLVLTGEAADTYFGHSVSSAGDVNWDGYGDVVVGAPFNDLPGTDVGRVYVYYGGPGADAVADVTLTGEAASNFFGISVSGAGDVNGDGHGDVIVGAYGNGGFKGRAYVYDFNRYQLLSPNGAETWNVGATKSISWLGAEPANVWLSSDGGNTYKLQFANVGGADANSIPLRVPHLPSKFARVRLTPNDASLKGRDQSDSMFTIQTSVALLALLAAPAPDGAQGAVVTWQTDPGPEDLAGYRLEKSVGGGDWKTVVALTRETSVADPTGGPGAHYRLLAVNGFGEELWLGETSLRPLRPLAAWPLPYRGGALTISFASAGGLGAGGAATEVGIYDVSGRLVRRVVRGIYNQGYQTAAWDGRDDRGRHVAGGIYFLRVKSALGAENSVKIPVLR